VGQGLKYLGGIIDSNYRGEWGVCLVNLGGTVITVESLKTNPKAKAIAQVVFVPRGKAEPNFVLQLPESNRGEAWKGSTDGQ
jgi:dUTPase